MVLTWGLGLLLASPIPVLALLDIKHLMPGPHSCEMNNQHFLIFGSLLSFYIPMIIMVTTYTLTIHQLSRQNIARSRHVLNKAAAGKVGRGEAVQCGELQEALTVSRENIAGTETHHRYQTLHKEPKLKETYLDAAKFY